MKRFLLALVFCLVLIAGPIQAQQLPTLSSLEIMLWPEYDRPELLVIYRGKFAEATPLPVQVDLLLPPGIDQPTAVAFVGDDGQRFNQDYTTRTENGQVVVSFELSTLAFQLEYYAPFSVDGSGLRDVAYSYTADYAVSALSLEVQVPPTAQAFTMNPPSDSTTQGSDGFIYQAVEVGSLAAGETRSWTITYQKTGSELTADSVTPAALPIDTATPAAQSSDNSMVIIFALSFVALVAVGAGAFWLGKQTQPAAVAPRGRSDRQAGRRRASPQQPVRSSRARDGALFCHQCGASLRSDSEFCHKCGTQVHE
jgi:hypothetical protein